jgi:hypothetical protein
MKTCVASGGEHHRQWGFFFLLFCGEFWPLGDQK